MLDRRQSDKIKHDLQYRDYLLDEAKRSLFECVLNDTENQVEPWDAVFRFQVDVIDDLDIVGRCTRLQMFKSTYVAPENETPSIKFIPDKLSFKERLKILVKGRL